MDTYVIQKGDTLDAIAEKYNIPAIDIIKVNELEAPYTLTENSILYIPTAPTNIFNYYKVQKGDTLYQISQKTKTDVSTLAQINGLKQEEYIYPDQVLLIPKENVATYITKEGDTIDTVAEYFRTYPQNILYNNRSIYLLPDQLIVYRKV